MQTASWNRPVRIAGTYPTGRRGGLLALLAAFVAVAVTVGPAQLMVATAYADADACAAQQSALDADNQAIADLNGRLPPGGSAPSDVADPYNQEAAQLNAKGAPMLRSFGPVEPRTAACKTRGQSPSVSPIRFATH